jgi:hypothetical protein
MSSYLLFQNRSLAATIPWVIQMTVLMLIVLRHKWVKYGIKGWSLFFILGSGLQLFAQVLFIIGDAQDKIDLYAMMSHLVKVLLGFILFVFADKSIKSIEEKVQRESQAEAE